LWDARLVAQLVMGQAQRMPWRRVPEDRARHPGIGGEDQMAQRLEK